MRRSLLTLLGVCSLLSVPCLGARTVVDELGRTVAVPDQPRRIICIMPNVADDLYALGAGDSVIAVSDFTKYPANAASKPKIGLPLTPSIETILSLHPDLVIGNGNLNSRETADRLESSGIPVFMIDPHGLEGIYTSLLSLGHALHREAAAAALVAGLRARAAAVQQRVAGKPAVRVFMPIWYDPVLTIGKSAFITELIAVAGGRSITDDLRQEWPQVSLEAVVARSPDAILLMQGGHISPKDFSGRSGWDSLEAVRSGHYFYADDRLIYPSPVAFDGLENLAKQFHP